MSYTIDPPFLKLQRHYDLTVAKVQSGADQRWHRPGIMIEELDLRVDF